jgi:hypothetical protein
MVPARKIRAILITITGRKDINAFRRAAVLFDNTKKYIEIEREF